MFCSDCGHEATGKFCVNCGRPLGDAQAGAFDWRESCDYERITQVDEVRRRVAVAKDSARTKVSGSHLLGLVDAAAAPLTGGISSLAIAKVAQPLAARIGLKTAKDRREFLQLPPGVVLGNLAVTLAAVEHTITSVVFGDHGCLVRATLPADLRAMESQLSVEVRRGQQGGSWVVATAVIEGQWYDWGKCRSGLDRLLSGMKAA
ncbi:MAG: hypothetical protein KDA37_15520 [Planctomycetales bacterium]|nr:hypothetical protein [Planctomycetales bacterium]